MEPGYLSGDHVLTFNWRKVVAGDVVVFKLKGVNFIKRINKIKGDWVYVFGDNKVKSSKVGPIKKDQIIGRVIWKY